jgi:ABC-type amino acid transport substrate-binding protein
VVGPSPLLNWYLQTQGRSDFMLVGKSLHHPFFGFAVNTRRLDVNKLNQAILGLLRDTELDPIIQKWFGKD